MKSFLIYLPLAIAYLSFKSTVAPGAPMPDIPLLMVFFLASTKASAGGVFLSFLLGYMDDIFNSGVVGASSFAFIALFMAVHLLARWVDFSSISARAVSGFILTLVKGALVWALLRPYGIEIGLFSTVPAAVVTAFFAPVVMSVFRRIPPSVAQQRWGR
jgi:rod shape-determining protein MreD